MVAMRAYIVHRPERGCIIRPVPRLRKENCVRCLYIAWSVSQIWAGDGFVPCNGDVSHHVRRKIQPSYTDAKIMIFFAMGGIFDRVFTMDF